MSPISYAKEGISSRLRQHIRSLTSQRQTMRFLHAWTPNWVSFWREARQSIAKSWSEQYWRWPHPFIVPERPRLSPHARFFSGFLQAPTKIFRFLWVWLATCKQQWLRLSNVRPSLSALQSLSKCTQLLLCLQSPFGKLAQIHKWHRRT